MTTRIKLRRDDTTNWDALNPVLALGEPGYNTTVNKIKIGDGVTTWANLSYLTDATGNAYTLTAATTNVLGGVKLGEGFVLNASNQVTTSKLYSTNETDANVHYRLELDTNGVVVLPDQSIINGSTLRGVYGTGELNYTGITIGPDANHREESWVWVDVNGAHVAARYSGNISTAKQWDFKNDGNLQLPAGGYILNSSGQNILAGLGTYSNANVASYLVANPQSGTYSNSNVASYLTTYTGNIGNISFTSGNLNLGGIQNPANRTGTLLNVKGIVGTTASSSANISGFTTISASNFTFGNGVNILSTVTGSGIGNVTLSQSSTIADTAVGIELTINRLTTEWYSVYGDINTSTGANATVVGSVVHGRDGNIYVLGSTVDYDSNNYEGHNLFLKYDTEGVLDWSRTWTDQNGIDCGSFNSSMRYLPATIGISDQETIYWSSYAPYSGDNGYAYVGTMDIDGNLVSGYGNARAPVQLANVRIADLEVATGSNVRVVGARLGYSTSTSTPFIATVNLATHTANLAITISPPYIDINNTNSYTNFFKSACSGTANNSVIAIGTYHNDDYGDDWPILTEHVPGGATRTYHLTSSRPSTSVYGEAVVKSSYHNALYVIMNEPTEGNYAFVGKLASNLSDYSWISRFDDGSVYLLGMTFDTDGFIYVVGEVYISNGGDSHKDFLLVKMDGNGNITWQRKIGSTAYEGSGLNEAFNTGWQSSTGISVQDDHVVIAGISEKLNNGQPNAFTIKYPTDGSLTGNFGQYYAEEIEVSIDPEWSETINNLTADTIVTQIDGNATFRNDVTEASLTATTKTLDAGYDQLHWDMTNNYLYVPERKWTFGEDGSITFSNETKLYEDEPGTLIIKSTGGTSINYSPYPFLANVPNNSTSVAGVTANQSGVAVYVEKKIDNTYIEYSQWQFNDNGGLGFPDGTTQYGAYIDQEIALDGGSAVSVFPVNITNPRLADGGGSGSRYGSAPNYDGSSSGATVNPNEFTLTLNGGGA